MAATARVPRRIADDARPASGLTRANRDPGTIG
jgi:hypothetical protein